MKLKKNLIWNYWANLNQTLLRWSLGGPLSKLCPSAPSCIQMAAITKMINFFKWPKLLYFKPECAQIWNDELFNMYYRIFYELWTFANFDRLCKLEKSGDEIKKKSSPLKLLSQYQPNFAEMILGWPPSKIVSGDPDFQPKWLPSSK